jgi:glucokinase
MKAVRNDQCAIAVDLGGTKTLVGLVDREGVVVRRLVAPTPSASRDAVLDQLAAMIEDVRDERAAAIGVGIPSTIDQEAGRAVFSVNIPLAGFDLRDWLVERVGLPAAIDNDANAAALAEHRFGAGRGSKHMIMLTLGTGIGGGLILDGRLYRGSMGAGAELGHITVDANGPRCQGYCSGVGHLEGLASGSAADALAKRLAAERPDGDLGRAAASGRTVDARLAVELAMAADGDGREVIETVARYLGLAVAGYVNVFNPELVVIGGGFGRAGEVLLEPIRRAAHESALSPQRDLVRIVPAALGVEAGLVGAGLLGFEALDAGLGDDRAGGSAAPGAAAASRVPA